MNQNAQKLISFMMSLTKITKIHETKKKFFIPDSKTC